MIPSPIHAQTNQRVALPERQKRSPDTATNTTSTATLPSAAGKAGHRLSGIGSSDSHLSVSAPVPMPDRVKPARRHFLSSYGSSSGDVVSKPGRGKSDWNSCRQSVEWTHGVGKATSSGKLSEQGGLENLPNNILVCTAASGGIGLSLLSAMMALQADGNNTTCTVVDADFQSGGLDVLLGLENEQGLRFSSVDAPLGAVDGKVLSEQLPMWEGTIRILAADPWNGCSPDWWEVHAVVDALAQEQQLVVVDAARGQVLDMVPSLQSCMHMVLVELSVLGLARGRAHLNKLKASKFSPSSSLPMVVGIQVHSRYRKASSISADEAQRHLGIPVLGVIRLDGKVGSRILDGTGIRQLPRGSEAAVAALWAEIKDRLPEGKVVQ